MKIEAEGEFVRNEFGELDIDYYIARARVERARVFTALLRKLFTALKFTSKPENKAPMGTVIAR